MDTMPELKPRVSFSATSTLRIYATNGPTPRGYSQADQDLFGVEALLEALRVKKLIERSPQESTKESLRFLFKNRLVAIEDIVGIESAILGQRGHTPKARRKLHAKTVLQKQHEQRWDQDQQLEDAEESLARVARESSLKSVLHARAKAALAART